MNISTLFRLRENLNLDRKTLAFLRWIAILGQLSALYLVYFYLKIEIPIIITQLVILIGIITNIYLQFGIKSILIKDIYAGLFLLYDLTQLTILLYLTGGIYNPFSILLIVPAIVSSTFLSMGTTIVLGLISIFFLFCLTKFHYPLPGIHDQSITFPTLYVVGYFIAIVIGLIFLCYFGIRFSGESKRRSEAVNKLQQVIAKEYELESLGGQAAAAAHSLGTPLATISVVASELKKEMGQNENYKKDIDLLISQTKRCSEILKQISQKQIVDDKFLSLTTAEDLLEDIIKSFNETTDKKINLVVKKDFNKFKFERTPETVYGIRNFIGNSIKFSKNLITVSVESDNDTLSIIIDDDGLGFPNDILDILGEPYIKSKIPSSRSGLGLGTFLGKTLLNRKNAEVFFKNKGLHNGARVIIKWKLKDLKTNF